MLLDNKIAFITGASRGIGYAIASIFAKNGAKLVLNCIQDEGVKKLETCEFKDSIVQIFQGNVASYEQIENVFLQINKQKIALDILVNNAGILKDALIGMITNDIVDDTISTNLNSVIYTTQFASRFMKKRGGGSIINLSSIIGRVGNKGQIVYSASKAGVIGATLSASKELGEFGIRVNAIAPGLIDTDMTFNLDKNIKNDYINNIAMKRIGYADEIAKVALFLASDLSSYVTGQVIGVDGGMVI
jgi:3-oxoacyl-[acyl-carrier protein] reductase